MHMHRAAADAGQGALQQLPSAAVPDSVPDTHCRPPSTSLVALFRAQLLPPAQSSISQAALAQPSLP